MSLLGYPEFKKVVLQISVRMSLKSFYPSAGWCVLLDRFPSNLQTYQQGQKKDFLKTLQNQFFPYFVKSLPNKRVSFL